MSYKQRKVVEIMTEITAIKGQTSYDVSGVKPEVARVCYRLPTENFKDLTSGDYTWTTTGSGYSLQINNEVVRNTAEAYQVYYVHDIQSSKYTTDFEVDINTLVTRYNEAVDDIHRLWLFTQKLAFVSDDTTIPITLPQLGEDEIWMRKGDGYVGVTLTDAEGMILDMINKYVTDKKQEISDHVTAELVKADKHILDETLKRIQEITEHTNVMKQEITDLTTAQKKILLDYVNLTLKPMLLAYVNDELKPMLLTYVNTVLKPDLESYTTAKKGELNTATQGHLQTLINKTNELLALLVAKESELETALSNFTDTLKTALNNHTNEKKSEITIHANSESQRVQAEVVAKGEEVKDEINQLIPDNIGVRVEALEGNRVLRSGDTMTGTLNINVKGKDKVVLKSEGAIDGVIGSDADGVIVGNSKSGKSIRLNNDGVGIYPSTSLKTKAKDLSEAVNELLDNKLDKGTYPGNASDLNTEISKIASTTQLGRIIVGDNLTIDEAGRLSGHPFPNYKGIYSEGTSYAIGDVVNVTGHEPCYVFETTLCEMSDPQHPKYFKKVYRIEDTMYYVKEKDGFEILFTKEEKIPFYTIPQKGEQQNYKSTVDDYFPYSDIRGVVFDGFVGTTIAQILDKNDATKQSNGSPSNLTTLGNVMNEYPKFYCQVKMTPQGRRYRIFSYKNPTKKIAMGIKPHPVFKKPDGSYKNFEYLSRYKGSHDGTRVGSLSGKSPYVNITQGTFRDKCRNGRNTNWNMLTFEQISMLQCLYIVEFGDLNSQAVLGQGRANTSSASATGTCNALGMRSGRISTDDANGNVCYRGYEDFYANIWDFIDGFMISNNGYHYTNDPSKFGNLSAMTLFPKTLNFKIPNGYVDKMEVIDGYEHLLIPYGTTGSATTYYCDIFYSHDAGEENIALFGGGWADGAACGCFCLSCHDVASDSGAAVGGRLSVFI